MHPNRLGIVGGSAGAITADHVAYALDDLGVGAPDFRFVGNLWGGIYLPAPTQAAAAQLDPGEAPLFAVHGSADRLVPVALDDWLVARARSVGVPVGVPPRRRRSARFRRYGLLHPGGGARADRLRSPARLRGERPAAMRRSIAFAAAAALALAATAPAADASANPAAAKTKLRILTPRQDSILSRGLRVRVVVRGKTARGSKRLLDRRRGRLRASSASFDDAGFSPISRTRKLRVRRGGPARGRAEADGCRRGGHLLVRRPDDPRADAGTHRRRPARAQRHLRAAAGRPQPRRGLRLHRPAGRIALHAAVPERLPHGRRSLDRRRAGAIDFHAAAMPDNAAGKPIDPAPYGLSDGFSPGETILVRVPGLDNPDALAATDAAPINHIGRYAEPDAPVVVIDAADRRAPADLGRDRLERDQPREHPARDPPGDATSPPGTATSSRCATCAAATARVIPAPEGFRYFRDDLPSERGGDQRPPRALRVDLRAAARLRDPALEPLPRLGLHRRQRREQRPPRPAHARRRLRPRSATPRWRDGVVSGDSPGLHRDRAPSVPADPQIARRITGTFTVPCYLEPDCEPGGTLQPRRRRPAAAQRRLHGELHCIVPQRGRRRSGPGAGRARRSTATGCSAAPARSTAARSTATSPASTGSSSARPTRSGCRAATSRTPSRTSSPTSRTSRMLADRLQQGLLNELFLSRLMIHPDGFASATRPSTRTARSAPPR